MTAVMPLNLQWTYRCRLGSFFVFMPVFRNAMTQEWGKEYGKFQAGRLRVRIPKKSLDFTTDLILPAALWLWDQLSL
jgi:hypothetical protein